MTYRITYGQPGSEQDLLNPQAGVYLVKAEAHFETNVSGTLTMQLPPNHPLIGKMEPYNTDMEVRLYEDGEELLRGRIVSDEDEIQRLGTIEVEDQAAYLNDVCARPYATYYTDDQGEQLPIIAGNLAQHLIEDYNAHCTAGREFSFLGAEVGDNMRVSSTTQNSIRDELADTIYAAGGFIDVRSHGIARTVQFFKTPLDGDQPIRLGENLLEYTHKRDYAGIVTAIIATGRRERDEEDTESATRDREFGLEMVGDGLYGDIRIEGDRAIHIDGEARFGIHEEKRSYEVSTPEGLLDIVERDLASSVYEVESIDVTAFDLHQMNPDIRPLRLNTAYKLEFAQTTQELMLTEIDLDLCDLSASRYHFGKLSSSLSRSGAKEGSKSRKDASELTASANADRNSSDKKYKHVIDGLDEIGDGIIDLEKNFDAKLDGVEEAIEAAKAAAENTAYGVCSTASSRASKTVTVAYPQGGEFVLKPGAVVSVRFEQANTAKNPTLNVSGTGAKPIRTNGVNEAIWQANQTVLFTYMDGYWCIMSAPVWTSEVIVGDPRNYNVHIQPDKLAMRIGDEEYIHADDDGIQVGFTATTINGEVQGRRNLHIGDDKLALRQGQVDYLTLSDEGVQVGMDEHPNVYIGSSSIIMEDPDHDDRLIIDHDKTYRRISDPKGLLLGSDPTVGGNEGQLLLYEDNSFVRGKQVWLQTSLGGHAILGNSMRLSTISLYGSVNWLGSYNDRMIGGDLDVAALVKMVRKSITATVNNTSIYTFTAADVGLDSLDNYWWSAINGDYGANPFFVTSVVRFNEAVHVHFNTAVSGSIRLNIIGIQTDDEKIIIADPGNPEGPEIFDDPAKPENPGIEE